MTQSPTLPENQFPRLIADLKTRIARLEVALSDKLGSLAAASFVRTSDYACSGVVVAPGYEVAVDGTSITVDDYGIFALQSSTEGLYFPVAYTSVFGGTFRLTDNTTYAIVVNYNDGYPVLEARTDTSGVDYLTVVPVFTVTRNGTDVHVLDWDTQANTLPSKLLHRVVSTQRFQVESGLLLGESATRYVTCTSGVVWHGTRRVTRVEQNSSTTPTEFWYHSGGAWAVSDVTQYNNTQYDNGTDLATLTSNRYTVVWVYRCIAQDHLFFVLGSGDYTLANAQASTAPQSLPPVVSANGLLIGRLIVQKSASAATQIDQVSFTGAPLVGTSAPVIVGKVTTALDFGSIAAGSTAGLTITVPGATVGQAVALGLPAAPPNGIVYCGYVSTTNTVTVRAANVTSAAIDPASASFTAVVFT